MLTVISRRWHKPGGYREVLQIAVPLILSTGAWSILLFVDRMFLSWHSPESIAAALPAGMASFAIACLFIGIAAYVNTFVAQYHGAKDELSIGSIVWQGIYLSITSLVIIVPAYLFAETLFENFGHQPEVVASEVIYFKTLMYSSAFFVLNNTLSSFFSGLGRTMIVMWVSVVITIVNIVLDYLFIFGFAGIPEMGIRGAAIATNIAVIVGTLLFLILIMTKYNRERYRTLSSWKFKPELFSRLIYYGFPNGLRLFIDMASFTAFIMIVGTLGTLELVASNIAFNINALSFLPMIGLMIGVSVVVGQRLGEDKPDIAETAVWSAIHIALVFFGLLGLLYLIIPAVFIWPFTLYDGIAGDINTAGLIIVLLRFVALFGIFDSIFLVFLGALEGAGDTHFIMRMSFLVSVGLLVIPAYLYTRYFDADLLILWSLITLNVMIYSAVFFWRFSTGPWKKMRVIT
jgi:MATE family multidrug resistance protein